MSRFVVIRRMPDGSTPILLSKRPLDFCDVAMVHTQWTLRYPDECFEVVPATRAIRDEIAKHDQFLASPVQILASPPDKDKWADLKRKLQKIRKQFRRRRS